MVPCGSLQSVNVAATFICVCMGFTYKQLEKKRPARRVTGDCVPTQFRQDKMRTLLLHAISSIVKKLGMCDVI